MDDPTEPRPKIFINPNFKKAHFNRNFLPIPAAIQSLPVTEEVPSTASGTVPRVHFNPAFLEKLQRQRKQQEELLIHEMTLTQVPAEATVVSQPNPIIKHTMRKLIRASSSVPVPATTSRPPLLAPLVKISKNKLVRSTPVPVIASAVVSNKPASYKLDRRPGVLSRVVPKPKSSTIRRYSLVRTNSISPRKVVITDRSLLKLRRTKCIGKGSAARTLPSISFASPNKSLVMLNINGVLYRSSSNKLQVQSTSSRSQAVNSSTLHSADCRERSLTIRGTRFLLDSSGTKLRKVPSMTEDAETNEARLGRIDIGGLTYKPVKDGTYVRTDVHRARNHLSLAKHKSIQVLTNRLRKCNIPCQIYRRLGKCSAQLKGKCPRLHDPKHVIICPRFLKGECARADECLLSHDVSLEKMPVCRFFLEGRCVKNDCPYLHKKVSEMERICDDFLRGYCPLAAKCLRRHEFVCPEYDRLGLCERSKCPYPHGGRKDERTKGFQNVRSKPVESVRTEGESSQVPLLQRYYLDREVVEESDQLSVEQKSQLKRLLGKVEKMKQGHVEDSEMVSSEVSEFKENADVDDEDDDDDDGDHRPPIMKRAKLGPLPSFIPI